MLGTQEILGTPQNYPQTFRVPLKTGQAPMRVLEGNPK